jgi:hypothetical protein
MDPDGDNSTPPPKPEEAEQIENIDEAIDEK